MISIVACPCGHRGCSDFHFRGLGKFVQGSGFNKDEAHKIKNAIVFAQAAQAGIACGLKHRYEWFFNALRMLQHGDYTEISERTRDITEAFIAFEKGTASCPEEQEELDKLDYDRYITLTDSFYAQKGKKDG